MKHRSKLEYNHDVSFVAGYGCDLYASGCAPWHPDWEGRQIRWATLSDRAFKFFDEECKKCKTLREIDELLAEHLVLHKKQEIN